MNKFALWLAVVILLAFGGAGANGATSRGHAHQCRTLRGCRAQVTSLRRQVADLKAQLEQAQGSALDSLKTMKPGALALYALPIICDKFLDQKELDVSPYTDCKSSILVSGGQIVIDYGLHAQNYKAYP